MVWMAPTGGPMNVTPAAASAACVDDRGDLEVAVSCGCRTDRDGEVRRGDVARGGVRVAVDGNRPDPHRLERADHPDGDLAAVGNQNRMYFFHAHRLYIRKTP
jgi:hypothetical protein